MNEKKHKIAMIGHKRIPSREGGVEIVVEELATRMAAKGHDVTCYNRRGKHVMNSEIKQENIKEYKGVKIKNDKHVERHHTAESTATRRLPATFSARKPNTNAHPSGASTPTRRLPSSYPVR